MFQGQLQSRGLLAHNVKSLCRQLSGSLLPLTGASTPISVPLAVIGTDIDIRRHCHLSNYRVSTPSPISGVIVNCPSRNYGRYEPDYLDPKGPQVAKYELVNLQLTGYDFTILEEFGKFVHNSAERFGYEVEDAWGTPSKHLKITRLKPESTVVDAEYKFQLYERNIQVSYPESPTLSLFVDIIHSSLPAGVKLKVQPHFKEYTEVRFIPDLSLKEVRTQLDELISGRTKKKK